MILLLCFQVFEKQIQEHKTIVGLDISTIKKHTKLFIPTVSPKRRCGWWANLASGQKSISGKCWTKGHTYDSSLFSYDLSQMSIMMNFLWTLTFDEPKKHQLHCSLTIGTKSLAPQVSCVATHIQRLQHPTEWWPKLWNVPWAQWFFRATGVPVGGTGATRRIGWWSIATKHFRTFLAIVFKKLKTWRLIFYSQFFGRILTCKGCEAMVAVGVKKNNRLWFLQLNQMSLCFYMFLR